MKFFLLVTTLFLALVNGNAQVQTIIGTVKDRHSDEPILYATLIFQKKGNGTQTDSVGKFLYKIDALFTDTLAISCIGYETKKYFIGNSKMDTLVLNVYLDRAKSKEVAVVKTKFNRGLMLWRKIIKNKNNNDRFKFNSFSYDLYNKMELDIVNLNKEKLRDIKLLRPFAFILNNVDTTSEIKPLLPIFITETFSKYYLQNKPRKTKEVITASRTSGIDNESVSKLLGGMYSNVNLYNNFLPIFNTDFVSPFSDNGDSYYTYKVVDTQLIAGHRCFKMTYLPRRSGDNTFVGECWVADTSFAVVNVNLTLDKQANINYVEKITMFQECKKINNEWILAKEKFVVNVAPVGKNSLTITGRKTTNYSNFIMNDSLVFAELKKNKTKEDIILQQNALQQSELFWQTQRPELLNKNEASIYQLMDTLKQIPLFKKYSNTINFLTTGTKWVGNYEIGPWYNWVSGNSVEGTRFRFDLGTNPRFNKKIYLHGYLAYGTKDRTFKGKAEAFWLLSKEPRMWVYAGFQTDYDNGQTYYDEVSQDNIFALAVRKPNVPIKFLFIKDKRVEFFKEMGAGFSGQVGIVQRRYEPIRNLPLRQEFPTTKDNLEALNNFETYIKIRYAYLERFLEGNFYRTSLGSPRPIVEAKFSQGFQGVFGSAYQYSKVNISVSDFLKTPPYGSIYYNVFAGKIFGTLPYMLLETHPGNEIFYYNKYAFNMMNRFEYLSDKYAGINVEHNVGNGLFKFIPITRKLKFRQFWNAKVLWGNLSEANKALNIKQTNTFKTLQDQTYMELGTGVDNILKVLRIDFIWRVAPRPLPDNKFQRFAVFGSFRLAF